MSFAAASSDGNRVFFRTNEKLTSGDDDGNPDIYRRDIEAGSTALVSTAGTCPGELAQDSCNPTFGGASADGSRAFFESVEEISAQDNDAKQDVYEWSGGPAALVSFGLAGGDAETLAKCAATGESVDQSFSCVGPSSDGSSVYFVTSEPLVSEDRDAETDIYRRSGGQTSLVSTGTTGGDGSFPASFKWASPDGSTDAVIFTTAESLVAEDEDEVQDVYEHAGETTTLLSTGPGGGGADVNASFSTATNDASRVFFSTAEPLVADDGDTSTDVYERTGEATARVSVGALNGNGAFDAGLRGISADGAYAFFTTAEQLTEGDVDAEEKDIYQRSAGVTLLVSRGNGRVLGPAPPSQLRTSPASPGESLTPTITGQAAPGAAIKVYTTADCSDEPVATGTAEELATTGLRVTVAEGSTTSFRATAEADGIVSGCSNKVDYKQEYPAPPPPPPPPPGEESGGAGGGGSGSGGDTGGGTKATGGKKRGNGSGAAAGNGGIAYVTPDTRITFGPAFKTRRRRVVFRFTDATGQPGTNFICRLDHRRWHGCSSPMRLRKLKRGRHVFRVKARNALGSWEAKPTRRHFKVVRRRVRRR
jgi:hypothetical protein